MDRIESTLREVRQLLAAAHQHEVEGEIEAADALGAIAANKLARANRWSELDAVVVPIARAVA